MTTVLPILTLLISFSLVVTADAKNKKTIIEKFNCLSLYEKVGVGAGVLTLITGGLLFSWGGPKKKDEKTVKIKPHPMPTAADISINKLENDRDLFSRGSDLTDYILVTYAEDPKFSRRLSQFINEHPLEALTALRARTHIENSRSKSAKELFKEMGRSAYYPLTFAWIITEVYNEGDRADKKTLRNIVEVMESSIQTVP
ncbi:MAG: hypothetical protein EXR74_02930 [Bdellovibrionales bacterium]|nr:hypothetical protein [Bdellovibrionales bacterium]